MRMVRWAAVATIAGAPLLFGSAAGHAAEDDLAVVKRATAGENQVAPESDKTSPAPKAKGSPTWLKVRVTEKAGKKARVAINVPLALVRALGDECPFDFHVKANHEGGRQKIRLGDLLKALDAGQQIVEIEDEESSVRVWVE